MRARRTVHQHLVRWIFLCLSEIVLNENEIYAAAPDYKQRLCFPVAFGRTGCGRTGCSSTGQLGFLIR